MGGHDRKAAVGRDRIEVGGCTHELRAGLRYHFDEVERDHSERDYAMRGQADSLNAARSKRVAWWQVSHLGLQMMRAAEEVAGGRSARIPAIGGLEDQ